MEESSSLRVVTCILDLLFVSPIKSVITFICISFSLKAAKDSIMKVSSSPAGTFIPRKRKMTLEELKKIPKDSIAIFNKVYDEAKAGTKQLYEGEGELGKKLESNNLRSSYAVTVDPSFARGATGGWILTRSQMRFLSEKPYLYCASAGSYLEVMFLQKLWYWLATFIPTCVAPCVITCTGLLINVACSLNVIYFAPDLQSEAPSWAFALCAVGVFLYQTLDALDGKQSFKVQNSQLEEIYDHMCDAVSTVFVTLSIGSALQLAYYPTFLYLFFLASVVAFYCTHWTCHVTHTMVFGKVDVSEAQWAMILAHAVTAYCGQRVWHTVLFSVFGLEITLVHFLAISSLPSLTMSLMDNVKMATFGKKTPLEEMGICIPRRGRVYQPLIPLLILISLTNFCFLRGLMSVSPTAFILMIGFSFAKLTMTLVMANISKGEMEMLDSSMAVPFLLAVNSVFPLISSYTALLCALVYCVMDALRFFTYSSWDLRTALDVNTFSIKYPLGHEKNRGGDNGFYINGLNNEKVLKEWQAFQEEKASALVDSFKSE